MFNIGIVGSRTYPHLYLIENIVDGLWEDIGPFKCISGGAQGVDITAEKSHLKHPNAETEIFYPEWKKYGKAAGLVRNTPLVKASDLIICFYNSLSDTRGCLDTLRKQIELYKPAICLDDNKEIAHWFLDKLESKNIFTMEKVLSVIEKQISSSL